MALAVAFTTLAQARLFLSRRMRAFKTDPASYRLIILLQEAPYSSVPGASAKAWLLVSLSRPTCK